MDGQYKPKVTAKIDYNRARPPSPFKQQAASLSPPLIRAKAKVNSSATIQARKPAASVSSPVSVRGSVASARAPSPFKPSQSRPANASPAASAVKARLTARTNGNNSTSPLPDSRQRALTAVTISPAPSFPRHRRGSASSNLLPSSSRSEISTAPSPVRSALALSSNPDENTPTTLPSGSAANVNVRVRAKISKVADPGGVHSPPSHPASPHLANRPARVPSISSLSLSPPMMPSNSGHSPSSTSSSPLAPPVRFGSTRETKHHSYQAISKAFQAFTPNDDLAVDYGGTHRIAAKVDPAAIPLPPQSPPISTLSFSSRSSASRSSVSYDTQDTSISRSTAPTLNSHLNGNGHSRHGSRSSPARASMDGLGFHSAPVTRDASSNSDGEYSDEYDGDAGHHASDSDDEDRKMKAQAKSNRKIADLEITNRSLLAINATLEATKHKQQKEIRELRRKLRESRLILPPPAYRAVKSSLSLDEIAAEEEDDEEDEEDEDDEENKLIIEGKADEAYQRVKGIIESLLEAGQRALESKPEDFVSGGKSGGAKVLTAEEVRSWRGDDDIAETRSNLDVDLDATSMASSRPLTPSRVAVPDSDDGLGSEDEVEASLLEPDIHPPAPLPPITITPSAPQ